MNRSTERRACHVTTALIQRPLGVDGSVERLDVRPVAQTVVWTEGARHERHALDSQLLYRQRVGRRHYITDDVRVQLHSTAVREPHHVLERPYRHFGHS